MSVPRGADDRGRDDDRLRCRRSIEETLAQVADGRGAERDEHQRGCLHCQAALAEYERLWSPVREAAAQRIAAPDSVLEAALRRIRGAVEHSDYGVLESSQGVTRIAARVVVVAARETARGVPGVRVALSKHVTSPTGADEPEVTAGVAGRSTAIEITLAADHGLDLVALGERVRREVAARVQALTDLVPVEITVIVDDVFT
jgi:uncharacterized alkaline shock family protein YloU